MALEIIDLVTAILILIMGFSLFTNLVSDYRTVSTVGKLMRKRIKVTQRTAMTIPIPLSIGELVINNVEPQDDVKVSVSNNIIRVENIVPNRDVKITAQVIVVGRVADYPVRGNIVLYH